MVKPLTPFEIRDADSRFNETCPGCHQPLQIRGIRRGPSGNIQYAAYCQVHRQVRIYEKVPMIRGLLVIAVQETIGERLEQRDAQGTQEPLL